VEYYSAIRKNTIMLFIGKWLELETILLSKISQTQNDTTCFLSYVEVDLKNKCMNVKGDCCRGEWEGKEEGLGGECDRSTFMLV
jgi:hypothetical protein